MSVQPDNVKARARLKKSTESPPVTRESQVVGKRVSRVDGPLKVKGKARFAAEVVLDQLTYGALAYSTITRGSIKSIDISAAKAAPGVLFIMTHENAPKMGEPIMFPEGGALSSLPVMQDVKIHWNGQPIAIVIAESQEQAEYAATLIRATYETEPATVRFDAVRSKAKEPDNILGEPSTVKIGDAGAKLGSAAVRVDNTYRTPRHNHCAIELHGITVVWEGDKLTVHDTSQMIHASQNTLAKLFGLDKKNVRVLSPFVGGGFGNKAIWNHHIIAIAAARELRRPVRMVLSREGVFRITGGRTLTEQRVALGANQDGTLAALIHTGTTAVVSHNSCPEQFSFPARHLYAAESFLISQKVVELDMVANTFMRAPGESVGTFALESALDELAVALKIDPIELRARIEPEKDPTSGKAFSHRALIEAYQRGAERFGWPRRSATPRAHREGDWLIGHGVATATYPYLRMPGAAAIRLHQDGRAMVLMGSHEMGMGTATAQAQYAAQRLGLPLEQVTFEYGDSAQPLGTVAGGSSQTASIIAAVSAATDKLFAELLKLAGKDSPLAGLEAQDVEGRDGGLGHKQEKSRFERYADILERAGRDVIECNAPAPKPEEMEKFSMHSYGAQFCEVRVNAITGETRVARFLGSFDTGRILNPKTAASQFRGGIIMGLGLALTEETLFDERNGRIMNPSLAEYHVPVHLDVPPIEILFNDLPDPESPMGVHGIGEIGITGVGAAIANAVYNATGVRVRDLPITLDKLM